MSVGNGKRGCRFAPGRWRKSAWSLAFTFLLAGLNIGNAAGQTPGGVQRRSPGELVSLDFDNAEIRVVIKQISDLTGRNFLVDEKVRGRVTIITPALIRIQDVYQVFLSLLHTYGFTAVPAGEITKILPLGEVTRSSIPTLGPDESRRLAPSDRLVTSIIRLENADSASLASLLRPMAAREGNLISYRPANALILTDTAANVRRLASIIQKVDVPSAIGQVVVVRLKYALAKDLAVTLQQLVEETVVEAAPRPVRPRRPRGGRAPAAPASQRKTLRIIPDERINALILVAAAPEMVRARSLVKKLDVPPPPERKRIHVYRLKNALAEELAKVLNQQVEQTGPSARRTDGAGQRGAPGSPPPPSTPSTRTPVRGAQEGAKLFQDVAITPDKATNSLIIRASPEDFQALTEIIEKLDVLRAQVLVEALIAEMTLDKARELGVEWRALSVPGSSGTSAVGGTNLPLAGEAQGIINQFATSPFGGPSGLVLGAARGLVTFGGQTFFDLRGLIRAFEADTDVNILSTPQILSSDNEEAEIIVGENRPFVTQSQTTAEGSTVQTFEFRDIGVKLRITPHISPNRVVRLKIFQEVLSFVAESQVGAVTTTKRQATTTVTVEDGQTVVIGGLIRDDTTNAVTKVPILGDIPFLGLLFRADRKVQVKTNLMIFITPRIITNPDEHRRLTDLKQGEGDRRIVPRLSSVKERM